MSTDINNKFDDAFRKSFPQTAAESGDGWAIVEGTLRRRRTFRRMAIGSTVAAAVLALAVFLPHNEVVTQTPALADSVTEATVINVDTAYCEAPLLSANVPCKPKKSAKTSTVENTGKCEIVNTVPEPVPEDEKREPAPKPDRRNLRPQDMDTLDLQAIPQHNKPAARKERKVSLSASARGMFGSSSDVVPYLGDALSRKLREIDSPHTTPKSYSQEKVSYKHYLPVGVSIAAGFPINGKFSLESGLDYTLLHSERSFRGNVRQQYLHMIGVPVSFRWTPRSQGNANFYVQAGVEAEKCVKATVAGIKCSEDRIQWSAFGATGVQFRLYNNVSIYLQPEYSYFFTHTDLETFRSDCGGGLSLRAGFRIGL